MSPPVAARIQGARRAAPQGTVPSHAIPPIPYRGGARVGHRSPPSPVAARPPLPPAQPPAPAPAHHGRVVVKSPVGSPVGLVSLAGRPASPAAPRLKGGLAVKIRSPTGGSGVCLGCVKGGGGGHGGGGNGVLGVSLVLAAAPRVTVRVAVCVCSPTMLWFPGAVACPRWTTTATRTPAWSLHPSWYINMT